MDENTIKEEFSYGYIKIIAALSGLELIVTGRPLDHAGIDVIIRSPGKINGIFSVSIDAQVKCTAIDISKEKYIKFPLKVQNYKRLIGLSQAPQLLIVVLVPKDLSMLLSITDDGTLIKRSAYWISLEGEKDPNNIDTITINIPKENLLTPYVLREKMEKQAERIKRQYSLENIF